MRRYGTLGMLFGAVLYISLLGGHAFAGDHGEGKDHGNGNGHGNKHDREDYQGDENHGSHHGHGKYFRDTDHELLERYYSGPRDLPPGLRKKYYRTGSLPPGWEKRFQPMPIIVVQQLPPVPVYYERGYLDGYAVVYDRRTRVIVDVVDLVGALTGR